jgi:molecular chaperone DnaK (HSP70)
VGGGIIEVIWTGGDAQLGGDDFDRALAAALSARHARAAGPAAAAALAADRAAGTRLVAAARRARERLSSAREATVTLAGLPAGGGGGGGGPAAMEETVTLADMEAACRPLLERLTAPLRQVRSPVDERRAWRSQRAEIPSMAAGRRPRTPCTDIVRWGGRLGGDWVEMKWGFGRPPPVYASAVEAPVPDDVSDR